MPDLRAYQPSFTAGELSPALWARTDLSKYGSGLKTAVNLFIYPHGGAANRAGFEFVNEVKTSANLTRLIPFQFSSEQSCMLEFGNLYARVYVNGGLVLHSGSPYEFVTPYVSADLAKLTFVQDADVMYICHVGYAPRKLARFADDNWTLTTPTFAPLMTTPTGAAATRFVGSTGPTTYSYEVAAISAATGEESLPCAAVTCTNDLTILGNQNKITWTAVTGAARYIVYKLDNGVYGYIGGTAGLAFIDDDIAADLGDTPQTGRNPFVGAGNYPRCATFVEQRLVLASTTLDPQAVFMSQSANYENFGYASPAKDSDAITFRIKGGQVNEIRGLLPLKGLMALTSGAEWIISGGSEDFLTPSNPVVRNQGYRGASYVQPVVVGNTVLFAQARGGVIRDFSYDLQQDSFVGTDLTILARHMFQGRTIKAWAFAQAPFSMVWVVLDDGSLVTLTYLKEHEVWAWTRQETDGVVEDVSVIAENGEDVPYFIVRRLINGVQRRYIERLHTREFETVTDAFFVDSGLSYSGSPVSTIYLPHLKGREIIVLADGNVVRDNLVADLTTGAVTLPNAASVIHAGLSYTATLQTLDLDLGSIPGMGTVQGRWKSVTEATLRVENTRGIWTGTRDGTRDDIWLTEYKQRAGEAWNEAIAAFTGDIHITPMWDWTKGGSTWIKQFDPLPMTILAIMPDVTLGK